MIINSKKFKKFITSKKIKNKINFLAKKINKDYKDKNPLFLCILDGSFMFASQLYKKIKVESEISFVKIKSYKGTKSNEINNLIGINQDLEDKDVVIVEDIVDTGKTIKYILDNINCRSIRIATLLSKPEVHNIKLDYVGFEIPNKFVIGYGLDYNGLGRNLKEIYQIS
jgi:hypoxanthine phosphoribosyltransferase